MSTRIAPFALPASLAGQPQGVDGAEWLLGQARLGLFVGEPAHVYQAGHDFNFGQLAVGIDCERERKGRRDFAKAQPQGGRRSLRQHRHHGLGQIEAGGPGARIQVERTVGRHQRGGIGDVHPETAGLRLEAHRIVGRIGPRVVDGERGQMGQVTPLVRQHARAGSSQGSGSGSDGGVNVSP